MDLEAFRQDVLFNKPREHMKIWWEIGNRVLFGIRKTNVTLFQTLARPFPKRDLTAIVDKVRSSYAANKYYGRWTEEEDEKLKGYVLSMARWKKVLC